jgi:hypothetical protein
MILLFLNIFPQNVGQLHMFFLFLLLWYKSTKVINTVCTFFYACLIINTCIITKKELFCFVPLLLEAHHEEK